MHLLYLDKHGVPRLSTFPDKKPEYAILSHTWGADGEEVSFQDIQSGKGGAKLGYVKVVGCGQRAAQDGLTYFWVDSCCIDKTNKEEESSAIKSMFRWYRQAAECYVFLADVHYNGIGETTTWDPAFRLSRWFTRGWTLQELLAPKCVTFFSSTWRFLGDKISLEQTIHEITRLPLQALQQHIFFSYNFTERYKWASKRQTKIEEDLVYCLQGIFDVSIEPHYGEGQAKALERLEAAFRRPQMGYLEIKRWLAAPDPTENHTRARKLREPYTGMWYLESDQHLAIKAGLQCSVWLYGIPGSGKSVLCSHIIDDLLTDTWADPRRVVVFFYFDFQDKQRQDATAMLRSLIEQLLSQSEAVPSLLNNLFTECDQGRKQPINKERYLEALEQMMGMLDQVFVILDALDECSNQEQLFGFLRSMQAWLSAKSTFIFTSRRERDIETALCAVDGASEPLVTVPNAINLTSDLVDRDIQRFVDVQFQKNYALTRWRSNEPFCSRIKREIVSGAKGMFRWAVCQLDVLSRCRRLADVEKALFTLPATLDETYERILMQIKDDDHEYAIRLLRILTLSEHPLLLEELVEILLFHGDGKQVFDRSMMFARMQDIIEICRTLVTPTIEERSAIDIFPYFAMSHVGAPPKVADKIGGDNYSSTNPFEYGLKQLFENREAQSPQRQQKEGLTLAHYIL